jgi:hypothetical protein
MPSVSNAAAASAVDHIQDLGAYVSASPSSFHLIRSPGSVNATGKRFTGRRKKLTSV